MLVGRHAKIGSRRVEPRLDSSGVCWSSIPLLQGNYRVIGVGEVGIIGRAPKDFVTFNNGVSYIAKKPVRQHNGFRECVTEYLIAELGRMLPLRVAEGRLARLPVPHGTAPDVRFMSRFFLGKHEMLVHGVELVAQCFNVEKAAVEGEVSTPRDERAFYTVDLVDEVLGDTSPDDAGHLRLRDSFARMLAFDALLGANDRHASNWGIVQNTTGKREPRFSPVFDTARGLFLDRSDQELVSALESGDAADFVARYAARSRPLIGAPANPDVNHFELVRYLVGAGAAKFGKPAKQVIFAFKPERVVQLLHSKFARFLRPVRLRMIDDLLRYRWERLKEICRDPEVPGLK